LVKHKFGLVFRRIENKLRKVEALILVFELFVLHGLFGKRKEQYGTGHVLKARLEKKVNKRPWL